MVRVTVPATSANVGSGFDTCGLAVGLYNIVEFYESDCIDITSKNGKRVPSGENNLIYSTAKKVFELNGKSLKGLKIVQTDNIPMARGLGSSSACIIAGMLGANEMLGNPMTSDEILTFATRIEGHPDNVAPALLGGFVTSVFDGDKVYSVKKQLSEELQFAAFIPNFKLLTERARKALPHSVSHKDAVYNLSRSALLSAAFCEQRYELLKIATQDTLHQKYRLPLIKGGKDIMEIANSTGALAAFISGAGPTILSVVNKSDIYYEQITRAMMRDKDLDEFFKLHMLDANNEGATVQTCDE